MVVRMTAQSREHEDIERGSKHTCMFLTKGYVTYRAGSAFAVEDNLSLSLK